MKRRNNAGYVVGFLFMFIGAFFLMIGVLMLVRSCNFKKIAVEEMAQIVRIEKTVTRNSDGKTDTDYDVYVSFEHDGKFYDSVELPLYTSRMIEGQHIKILCNPDNPYEIEAASAPHIFEIITISIGSIFVSISGISMFLSMKKHYKRNKLLKRGGQIMAVIDGFDINRSYSVNNTHPYVIYCSYVDERTGTVYKYVSDNLWNDPSMFAAPGMHIPVYVDEKDYSQYVVDVESIMYNQMVY